ncbi:hypothetical protein G195_002971 [Phytophthora kernoviae 00238/432]|uniref:PI31 proteasome regulator C-terminal domain-containing protein n=1 Tax=Phytophthora kernoviae 00238/432 TaxID=1284355 RepID=A0A8J4SAP4_9STRA|nr:hypothetical protein G195_002971 [Phytophthora kernoviae 00238/432]
MADEQLQRDQAALRAAIDSISNETLKTYMLAALSSFDSSESITSSPAPSTAQTESGKSDAVVKELMKKEVKVQEPRDALFVAIHALLLEAGGGDAFPPNLGGGNPDMMVGPDHPLFGRRGDPSMGPVPGARFDPFGPSIDPLGPSGFGRVPGRGPAPRMPFGGPGPDHLRMPRDNDDMDPGFGLGGNRGGGGFSQPFGSNNAFF